MGFVLRFVLTVEDTASLLSMVKTFDSVLSVYEGFCNLKQVQFHSHIGFLVFLFFFNSLFGCRENAGTKSVLQLDPSFVSNQTELLIFIFNLGVLVGWVRNLGILIGCDLQVDLRLKVCRGSKVRKILVREAKSYGEATVVVGTSKAPKRIGSSASFAKYCARKLSKHFGVFGVNNSKVVFQRAATSTKAHELRGYFSQIYIFSLF